VRRFRCDTDSEPGRENAEESVPHGGLEGGLRGHGGGDPRRPGPGGLTDGPLLDARPGTHGPGSTNTNNNKHTSCPPGHAEIHPGPHLRHLEQRPPDPPGVEASSQTMWGCPLDTNPGLKTEGVKTRLFERKQTQSFWHRREPRVRKSRSSPLPFPLLLLVRKVVSRRSQKMWIHVGLGALPTECLRIWGKSR